MEGGKTIGHKLDEEPPTPTAKAPEEKKRVFSNVISPPKEIKLRDQETVEMKVHPHWLAFYPYYFIWLWVIILSLLFMWIAPQIGSALSAKTNIFTRLTATILFGVVGMLSKGSADVLGFIGIPTASTVRQFALFLLNPPVEYAAVILWCFLVILPAGYISFVSISWGWGPVLIATALFAAVVPAVLGLPAYMTYVLGILLAGIGMYFVDLYRLAHVFYVTNQRLVTQLSWGGMRRNELDYGNINNLILEQPLLGRMFNFGTIIPVTANGLGLGSDSAALTVGGGVGGGSSGGLMVGAAVTAGREVNVPRVRSYHALFGIENPQEVYAKISNYTHLDDEATHLASIGKDIKALLEENKKIAEKIDKK
ncbi:Bacterial PH domain protein [uncultured archaeon]|nr:Bacterial PH domain protein [uncultured archaeon]